MGESAAINCNQLDWSPVGPVDPSLVAETSRSARYGHGRAWSRSSSYALRGSKHLLYVVLTVEGKFNFTVDGETVTADAGQMVFLNGESPTTAQALTGTARYVWFFEPTILDLRRSPFRLHEPIEMNSAPTQSLIAMTNAMLNTDDRIAPPAQGHFGIATEHLIAAALHEAPCPTDAQAMHRDGLFTQAQLIIEARFRDPSFGVAEMARQLSCSRSQLHAVFSALGTTPRREIERRRISEVQRFQHSTPTLTEVIEGAGFLDTRKYRAALARTRRSATATGPAISAGQQLASLASATGPGPPEWRVGRTD